MLTLKERVENLEKISEEVREKLEELETIAKTLAESDGLESAQEIIQKAKEKVKEEIERIIATRRDATPEILTEFCRILHEELGINTALLEKKIREHV